MFYDLFKQLCDQKGVSPNRACLDMQLSRSVAAKWKNTGATPSRDALVKISDYFGVTVEYLLSGEKKEDSAFGEANVLREVYFSLAKEAQDNEIDPDDFRAVLKFYMDAKKKRGQ